MSVFQAIFPIVAVAGLGYLARLRAIITEAQTQGIERIAFWYLLPCLLFYGTATAHFPDHVEWTYLWGFYGVLFAAYLVTMALGRALFGYGLRELAVFGMGGAYANVTVLGIPITLQVLGQQALVPMLVVITVHNLLLFTFGTLLAELRVASEGRLSQHLLRVAKEMLLNPISGSLLLGAAWNLAGFGFYAPAAATLELIRPAAIPAALFALGAGLHRYHIRGALTPALVIVAVKMALMPLLMWWVMLHWLQVDPLWGKTAVMLGAMPVGISVYVFSRRYGCVETAVATAIVLSALLAVASVGVLVSVL